MTVTDHDREVLALTVWGEARGEGYDGRVAVAWSIRNRVHDGKQNSWWGEGYAGVCQRPWQFSCWNKNDPNYAFMVGARAIPDDEHVQCRIIADQVIDGKVDDPTSGATHYYATGMPVPPAWASGARQTLWQGRHLFFKDVL